MSHRSEYLATNLPMLPVSLTACFAVQLDNVRKEHLDGTLLEGRQWHLPHRTGNGSTTTIRIGLVARICRSQSSKDDQFRQGRGSIPRFGNFSFAGSTIAAAGSQHLCLERNDKFFVQQD
jgi:hypothetical protein